MKKFILELRRREVFRTAGLYVGVCWIVIEVASVLLPTFDAPEWALRVLIIATFVGFPIALVLAWIYDVTDQGVVVQADHGDTVVDPIFSRKTDFMVIGVLSVALILSLYMNFTKTDGPVVAPDPLSLLIADFDNQTGNPLFDGSLEQALSIGIEGASFVTAYSRDNALQQAQELQLGDALDEETARLVAVRQDVRMVLAGRIVPDGGGFDLTLRALDPGSGELIADAGATAKDALSVLTAMNELTIEMRSDLGEDPDSLDQITASETVTAGSLEAIKHYTTAQDLARDGRDEEAIDYYAMAIDEDAEFARAYSGWGLSARKLGRTAEAEEKWQQALGLLDRMTERERYRTLGLYSSLVSQNYANAIENYQRLVDRFPADGAGNNNLSVLYTMTAQYDRALAQSKQLLTIYPNRVLYHANHSQYAMYAGDIDVARAEAEWVLEKDPGFFKSYMILAIADLFAGDTDSARRRYERMAETGEQGQSLAAAGLADIELYRRDAETAIGILDDALAADLNRGDQSGAGTKRIALAESRQLLGDRDAALAELREIAAAQGDGQLVPTALIYAADGRFDAAHAIAEDYRRQLRPTARAYAELINGVNAYHQGEYVLAIDSLRAAIGHADLWIVRYYLALAYLEGGYPAEATAEFDACIERRSEAGNLFFDDVPTWRYTRDLGDLRKRANEALTSLAMTSQHEARPVGVAVP